MAFFSAAGADPMVSYGKEIKEFWLPPGKLTPLLHTRHLNVLASTFAANPYEQWMDRILVTTSDGVRLAEVSIKKDIASFNASRSSRRAYETIDLTLGMQQGPLEELPDNLPGGNKKWFKRLDCWVISDRLKRVFTWLPWAVGQFHIGGAQREAVLITSPDARFVIVSSPATEYYGDFAHLSVQYAHLDIHIMELRNRASVRGLLPEIWGLKKMSNRTKELTCPPWKKDAINNDTNESVTILEVDAQRQKQPPQEWQGNEVSI